MVSRKFANYKQQRKIEDLLLTNSTPHPEKENVRILNEGWTRERIAAEADPTLNKNHLRTVLDALEIQLLDADFVNRSDVERRIENLTSRNRLRFEAIEHRLKLLEDWKGALEGKSS